MNKKTRGYIELISYGAAALFSVSLFVFGTLFPKYMFVEESLGAGTQKPQEQTVSVGELREMFNGQQGQWESVLKDVKVTSLTYECLKEIIDVWN